jgi:F-type H+-transporting ATPase subunit a
VTTALLAALLALAGSQASPEATPAPHADAQHAAPAAGDHGKAAGEGHSTGEILMHHVVDVRYSHLFVGPLDLGPTKHTIFLGVVALVVIGFVQWGRAHYSGGVPRGPAALLENFVLFVRDEIAEKAIGHDGHKFTPLLCSFFFFILFAALIGLLPFSATPTGNVNVTLALAGISFLANQWAGISKYGFVHHYKGMLPSGLPLFLVPIMIPVELLGMFARPFALTVRLFANMIAGHLMITTLLLLIPLMAAVSTGLGVVMIPVSLGLGLFVMMLELLVALLQAFIFTLLSAIFIGMSAHPSH